MANSEDKPNEKYKQNGLYAFRQNGEASLSKYRRGRLAELQAQFRTAPGREDYRRDLAVHVAMLLEIGFSNLRDVVEAGGSVWESPPTRMMGSWANLLARLLDNWPKEGDPMDITDLLKGDPDGRE